jgi:hypothetical protein
LSLLNTILTPIITGGAQIINGAERAKAITSYLENQTIRENLMTAATALAVQGNTLATASRLQALGQFEEKLAAVTTIQIDLSKCKAPAVALPAPAVPPPTADAAPPAEPPAAAPTIPAVASPVPSFVDDSGKPTETFISCYATAWQQISDAVQAAATAAGQYDTLADLSSDQLMSAVSALANNFVNLSKMPTINLTQLLNTATQLISYAQSVSQALSQDNVTKLQTDVSNLMKDFK